MVEIVEASSTGSPSMSTTWQPTLKPGEAFANCAASLNARPFAMSVDDVTMPRVCVSTMARFTPGVNPKSSALMMSRRKLPV
jgi:hypothetical protein